MKLFSQALNFRVDDPSIIIYIQIIQNNIYLEYGDLKMTDVISIQHIDEFNVIVKHNNKTINSQGLYFKSYKNRTKYDPHIGWTTIYSKKGFYYEYLYYKYTSEIEIRDNKLKLLLNDIK